ncbi:creatininase family protein [Paracidovorax konjaci]|uniref:Creatinine amidohydrolase/Fe(II)-dependent formamide hydrolase involved in riboflavin and F420 biosynthesis n=1 Tax=Paracidovorax konjaci TaxID=32040 RepID=A0A1I1TW11_9BURK|nr:creatininase family protein [Paracidovorax konjaci]SFD62575.1 Creatinine amidohydrolase/Fe(II)-dependent formamide hydrolase involved in riboflavin and F420 biosynthesis [Paracidovorax konjaci]
MTFLKDRSCFAWFRRWVISAVVIAAMTSEVHAAPNQVYLDEMTWTEARDAVQSGATTVIVPVGGTEQSGPHMALGKHNVRVHVLAGQIAQKLGNTLVAPVVAYVPEGIIGSHSGHMRFTGTISIPPDAFTAMLSGAARSLKQHGFLDIVFIGDHGGYQSLLQQTADRLNREWIGLKSRAYYVADYYRAADNGFAQALRAKGYTSSQIGTHAGLADTSLTLAVDPNLVRMDKLSGASTPESVTGISGDPKASSAVIGKIGTELIIESTVRAIREAVDRRR